MHFLELEFKSDFSFTLGNVSNNYKLLVEVQKYKHNKNCTKNFSVIDSYTMGTL